MKIGPFQLGRRATATAEPTPRARPPKTVGASGTINYHGFLQSDEYNPDLRGEKALVVFDKMLRSDGSVQEAIEHIFAPIKNSTVSVEPPENPTPDELVATALVEAAFFEWMNQPFLEYLDQALDYLAFGFQVFETSYQVVEHELSYEVPGEFDVDEATGKRTPKTVTVPSQQWIVWDRYEQRLQRTIWKWIAERGKLREIIQIAWTDIDQYEYLTIPAEQLVVYTNKRRGDNFQGRSLLRSAYKAWYMKELVERIEIVALERWGVGVIVAYPPRSKEDDGAYMDRLEDILSNIRAGESTYILAPTNKQGAGVNGEEGILFEIIGPTGTPPDFKSPKEYHRAEIKAAVLARFSELGHAQTGARSTGDTQSIVWFAALHAVARYIQDVHEQPIRRLVDANLTGITRYPGIVFSGIEEKDLAAFADAVGKVLASGGMRHDKSARGWIREIFDAPPEDEFDDSAPVDPLADPNATEPVNQNALSPAEKKKRDKAAATATQLQLELEGADNA